MGDNVKFAVLIPSILILAFLCFVFSIESFCPPWNYLRLAWAFIVLGCLVMMNYYYFRLYNHIKKKKDNKNE